MSIHYNIRNLDTENQIVYQLRSLSTFRNGEISTEKEGGIDLSTDAFVF